MGVRRQRHQRILELLGRNRVESQDQLLDLLAVEGFETTQSTVSRDLRELGVVKGPEGYRAPALSGSGRLDKLARELRGRLRDADAGGPIVVLRPSSAPDAESIARRIDGMGLHQVVAATACGGLVLLIARSRTHAAELVGTLRRAVRPRTTIGGSRLRRLVGRGSASGAGPQGKAD